MKGLIIPFLFSCSVMLAQNQQIHTSFPLSVEDSDRLSRSVDFPFTALALKSTQDLDFSKMAFLLGKDTLWFSNEVHQDSNSPTNYSTLIHFSEQQSVLNLSIPQNLKNLEVVLINGAYQSNDMKPELRRPQISANCELNQVVSQSDWRSGLPAPNYNRIFTSTTHLIVHHSAGSNTASNYRQVVRDIYIYHTVENGWSDIGYNYLIAPDGQVFAGRDPDGGKQDEVMGAHFCGSNSNTMGVCLLGNYQTATASQAMLESLEVLLSWKVFKDGLDPLATAPHPLDGNLNVIAGHRQGCSTLCPGEDVYQRLASIRTSISEQVAICSGEEPPEEPIFVDPVLTEKRTKKIYPNPIGKNYSFTWEVDSIQSTALKHIKIYTKEGKEVRWESIEYTRDRIEVQLPKHLESGIYFFQSINREGERSFEKFMILN